MASNYGQLDSSPPLVARHKRRGVALSCAECRRCSRLFPCSNCVKKGCSAICPDGSQGHLASIHGFVLANTEALHDKINQLSNRVRQLEDALSQSHALSSNKPHHLLSDDLLQIKRPLERERLDEPPPKPDPVETHDTLDAMGSLSISQGGRSTFFGRAANSWNEEGSDENEESPNGDIPMSSDIPWLNYTFPFAPNVSKTAEEVRGSIYSFLPRVAAARAICALYYQHAAWMYTPISESDFYETIFRPIYDTEAYHEPLGSHSLAVFCMILGIGTLLDLDKPAQSPEAMQFYQLGRAALALDPVLEEQSIPGIQALLLMCHFMFLSDMGGPRWVVMGIVVKLAHSVNRDSGKWNLNSEETQKRRELFYELLTYDSWQSLTFGRPPSLSSAHIDSKLPHETTRTPAGEIEMTFAAWKHRFSSQCLSVVHDQAFGARASSYKTIQDLDRRVPGFGAVKPVGDPEQPTTELTMQRYITFAIKEISGFPSTFYMHRGFFAQALEANPVDPMGSKYAPSVLAAYTSACSFVGLIESLFKQHPTLTERMWFLFTHVFSCAIVLGSIAVKSQMALAPSALSHLESAYNLFGQPILQKMKERAHAALSNVHQQSSAETATRLSYFGPRVKSEVDELSALGGGMTRLVSRRTSSTPSTPTYTGSSPSPQPASPRAPEASFQAIAEASSNWNGYTNGNVTQHGNYARLLWLPDGQLSTTANDAPPGSYDPTFTGLERVLA
ncbi:hypothetical protein BD779DRAFT_1612027 [Infundibulicybe gibba]|nr:hypothetical protein BD779DRAFT_1612027 [Infundibulicybe gibba]